MASRQRGQVLLAVLLLTGLLAALGRQALQAVWLQQHQAAGERHQLLHDSRLLARVAWLEALPIPGLGSIDSGQPWHPLRTSDAVQLRCGHWQDAVGVVCTDELADAPADWQWRLQRLPDTAESTAEAATDTTVFAAAGPQHWQLELLGRDDGRRLSGWQLRYRQLAAP